ncbi:MAG: DUF2846 domain-containing protein [Gammaproteobacteria bacterium]|nr:DUF2846 domain-containing protein [Gammaproteobacteria bacterium]
MNNPIKLILITVVLIFTGCASLPPPAQMKEDIVGFELPRLPEDGKAIVYIVRPTSLGGIIRFNVFVDDKEPVSEMGYTRANQYIYFNLEPGKHQILSKAENWSATDLTAKAGDIIFIRQEAKMGVFLARNSIYKIQEYEGKYHVKHLELGTILKMDK